MSLDNLVKVGALKRHEPGGAEVRRLLDSAQRTLDDARVPGLSDESRFDIGYKAIMQCALAALRASGYRPATSAPGHHQTMIASLMLTLAVPRDEWLVLDALRRKRNASDYSGDLIDPESVRECVVRAEGLFRQVRQWLNDNHAALVE